MQAVCFLINLLNASLIADITFPRAERIKQWLYSYKFCPKSNGPWKRFPGEMQGNVKYCAAVLYWVGKKPFLVALGIGTE